MSSSESQREYEVKSPSRDVNVDEDQYEMFKELQESEDSPFYDASNHDLFVFALGYGRKKAMPKSLTDKHAFFGRDQLSDAQVATIEAVAIQQERSVYVLKNKSLVYQIAEEYANGGIEELYGRVFGPKDDPLSELSLEVKQTFDSQTK